MKSLVVEWAGIPETLQRLYAPIRSELDQVDSILLDRLRSKFAFVDRLARHGFRLGGKRLRPALVLLAGRAAGDLTDEHVRLAAVVELIHTATLIHDDVLDEATLRRHLDTVNARWDNEASVLLGDFLLAQSFCMATEIDDPFASRALAEASRITCEGELRQVESRGDYTLSEQQYLEIITAKTSALTACSCRMGAHFAGAEPPVVEHLTGFGRDLGVAFQIADDLLDVTGDEARVGKSLGTDLEKQKPTLPLIHVLGRVAGTDRAELLGTLDGSDDHARGALRALLHRFGGAAYARQCAREFARRAARRLDVLPPSPGRDALQGLSRFVVDREQ